jgi:hypothetical protein
MQSQKDKKSARAAGREVTRRCMQKRFCMHTRPDSTQKIFLARTGPAVLLSGSKQKNKNSARAREVTGHRNGASEKKNSLRALGKWLHRGKEFDRAKVARFCMHTKKKFLRARQGWKRQHRGAAVYRAAARNKTLRAPQRDVTRQWAAASREKKNILRAREVTGRAKEGAPDTQTDKEKWRAQQSEWPVRKKITGALARQWRSDEKKITARQRKKLQRDKKNRWQTCDRSKRCCATEKIAGDRPARTGRSETGSTGPPGGSTAFNQDGPGKDWLKTAELKFSWPPPAELESSAGQASWTQKKS